MSTITNDRIFVIGGTGNVGSKCVQDLVNKNIPVTLLARNPAKVASLFPGAQDLKVIQGDYDNLALLETALPGHRRLFLLVGDIEHLETIKGNIASLAYAAGIEQILDISSNSVNEAWRSTHFGYKGLLSEQAILRASAEQAKRNVVTLRPTRFMSNMLTFDRPGPDHLTDHAPYDTLQSWISPNDIGALAAIILSDPIEKHGNAVYNMVAQVITPTQRAEIVSRVLGHPISYKQITPSERYHGLVAHLPSLSFPAAYHLATLTETTPIVTSGLSLLLGREAESLEEFLTANKQKLA